MTGPPDRQATDRDHRARGLGIVAAGVCVISFDTLLIRLADTDGWNVVFWRGGLMALSLLTLLWVQAPARAWSRLRQCLSGLGLVCTLLFGANNVLFVQSVSHTSVANTLVIFSSGPLFAGLFSHLLLGESLQRRTWVAIGTAMLGVLVVFSGSFGSLNLAGDAIALSVAICHGLMFTLLRRVPHLSRVALIGASGVVSAGLAVLFAEPFGLPAGTYAALGVMGLVQMPVALVLISTGTRYLPAAEVTLLFLAEVVLGPLLVWLFMGEAVSPRTLAGGGIIVGALAVHSWLALRRSG